MQLANNEHTFYCKVKGEKTSEEFCGDFTVKCILNQMEQVEVAIRTDRYNGGSTSLNPTSALINRTIAELEVRVIKSPTWWKDSDGGRKLYDTNVVFHVFTEAMKAEDVWKERIGLNAKKAEETPKKEEKQV